MFKKVLLIVLGVILIIFGLYGVLVLWWPFFIKVFLGCLGLIIFFVGLMVLAMGWTTEIPKKETSKKEFNEEETEKISEE
ncbi:MAG: hypothetical protein KBI15_02345 [Candidatus Pacebacteria bacterium]|nr:hypothetical protein [Candidatus Paceibacterota bacterium]